ncbi:BTAD domain-containing putative transcriptional regulator [Streptomyces fuscichromogenes]|uniref:AfsR/SARP family transcriptional regulator n=1 Tax=Streptomyces fuscichromogenes TaxID=1324013 RepID=UPI0038049356
MDLTVQYSLLGTVRALRGDTELDLGPPKRLALLALLLLRAPGPVSVSHAVDVLWDDAPPASAVNVVHQHIGALRKILEPGLRSRTDAEHLSRAADGYRLLVDASASDLLRFRDLRAQAQLAVAQGDPARAAQDLVEALRLWRSPVIADGTSVARHPVFTSVGHEFVATVKEATDIVLASAPALTEEVLAALRSAVGRHPFDEALHTRIIAALVAGGRQAEALQQYESIRRTLADELGVEPGPGLRSARQRLLGHGLAPGADEPAMRGAPDHGPAQPAQLPSGSMPFVERQEALKRYRELRPPTHPSHSPATAVALCGMPGVGKTTLAWHWAREAADRFPDGQIHVNLEGHHSSRPPLDPAEAMRAVLDALGVTRAPTTGAAALHVAYHRALAGRRVLVVLDDARDCEQVRPLLPAAPGCLAIVTSRRRLEGLTVTHDARVITLNPMTRQEGLQFLERRLGPDRIRAESTAAEKIVELCGGLPLTLAVACARALSRPGFPLASLVAQLRHSHAALSSHDPRTDVRSAFRRTYEALSTGAATLFRLLGLHPSCDITPRAAASLAGTELRTTLEHMAELADHHLLVELVPGRYTCHDLLRAYAAELSSVLDASGVQDQARARMFEHYLYSAEAASALLAPHRSEVILPPPRPGVRPQEFSGRAEAVEWITAERYLLPALARDARHYPRSETFRRQLVSTLELSLRSNGG